MDGNMTIQHGNNMHTFFTGQPVWRHRCNLFFCDALELVQGTAQILVINPFSMNVINHFLGLLVFQFLLNTFDCN